MRPARKRLVTGLALAGIAAAAACTYDFDQFEASDATGGSNASIGGDAPRGGTAGAETGGDAPTGGIAGIDTGGNSPTGGVAGAATGGNAAGGGTAGAETGGDSPTGGTGGDAPTGGVAGTATGGDAPTGGDPPTGGAAGAGTGGVAPTGGTAGAAGAPPTGGAATGGSPCDSGQKLCGAECVADDDPATGCGQTNCDACTVTNGVPGCTAGACAIASCNPGHLDCDTSIDTGCEISWGQFTDEHCGGCGNSCLAQGYGTGLVCQNGGCACTSAAQCGDNNGTFDCVLGSCSCEGVTCNPGETCSYRDAPDWVCGCNGQPPCAAGYTCCQTPSGCRDLQNDNANCGACGWQCPAGTMCTDGTCV